MTTTNDTTGMDTYTRHDEALYTRQIDDVVFQLDGVGALSYVDLRDGDEAQLVPLDKRQTGALVLFWGEIFKAAMKDALHERDRHVVDLCLARLHTRAE
jgi:hypothetical protein